MFNQRSQQKELLDGTDIPEADLFRNLDELDTINHLLGGYKISFDALKKICKPGQSCQLVDIGCGGGDTLKRIQNWQKKNGLDMELAGIDLKKTCIDYCEKKHGQSGIRFIQDDYRNVATYVVRLDVIHASLFCHHLTEMEIISLIQFCQKSGATLIINDLHRHPLAYYSIKWLTKLFSNSYLVKNDAPLSVLRGFSKKEWKEMLQKAGITTYSLSWKWAFRHQVIVYGKIGN